MGGWECFGMQAGFLLPRDVGARGRRKDLCSAEQSEVGERFIAA
jgi:hypothetical protein